MNLKALREAAGLSQYRLSQLSGVPQATIWRIEQGRQQPGARILVALSTALGCSTDALLLSQEGGKQ